MPENRVYSERLNGLKMAAAKFVQTHKNYNSLKVHAAERDAALESLTQAALLFIGDDVIDATAEEYRQEAEERGSEEERCQIANSILTTFTRVPGNLQQLQQELYELSVPALNELLQTAQWLNEEIDKRMPQKS